MPVVIDEETPDLAVGTGASVSTSSFTPPEGGLLVALVAALTEDTPEVSGGSLSWTRRRQQVQFGTDYAEIWTAPVTGSGSMTVTLDGLSATGIGRLGALKVMVVTGQHEDDPIGSGGTGTSSTNTLTANAYTSTAAGSRGFFTAIDSDGAGTPTVQLGDLGFPWNQSVSSGSISGAAVVKAAATVAAGTTVQFSVDAPGSGQVEWGWAALEIVAAPASPRPSVLRPAAAVHRAASW